MGYVLAIIRLLAYMIIFIIFVLIGLTVRILFFLSESKRFKWISFFTRYWAKTTCWILNFRFEVHGEISHSAGSLIVANHVGTPDVFILGAFTKGFSFQRQKFQIGPFLIFWHGWE